MWKDLSMKEKSLVMAMAIKYGLSDLDLILLFYDLLSGAKIYNNGGHLYDGASEPTLLLTALDSIDIANRQRWYDEVETPRRITAFNQYKTNPFVLKALQAAGVNRYEDIADNPTVASALMNYALYYQNGFRQDRETDLALGDKPRGTALRNVGSILAYADSAYSPDDPLKAHLLNRNAQRDYYLNKGYKEVGNDYGLVRKEVGDNQYPIFLRYPDAISRDGLFVIGNDISSYTELFGSVPPNDHPGAYPLAIYTDALGNLYSKSWDLNDYSSVSPKGSTTTSMAAAKLLGIANAGKMLDEVGAPVVTTSGFLPLLGYNLLRIPVSRDKKRLSALEARPGLVDSLLHVLKENGTIDVTKDPYNLPKRYIPTNSPEYLKLAIERKDPVAVSNYVTELLGSPGRLTGKGTKLVPARLIYGKKKFDIGGHLFDGTTEQSQYLPTGNEAWFPDLMLMNGWKWLPINDERLSSSDPLYTNAVDKGLDRVLYNNGIVSTSLVRDAYNQAQLGNALANEFGPLSLLDRDVLKALDVRRNSLFNRDLANIAALHIAAPALGYGLGTAAVAAPLATALGFAGGIGGANIWNNWFPKYEENISTGLLNYLGLTPEVSDFASTILNPGGLAGGVVGGMTGAGVSRITPKGLYGLFENPIPAIENSAYTKPLLDIDYSSSLDPLKIRALFVQTILENALSKLRGHPHANTIDYLNNSYFNRIMRNLSGTLAEMTRKLQELRNLVRDADVGYYPDLTWQDAGYSEATMGAYFPSTKAISIRDGLPRSEIPWIEGHEIRHMLEDVFPIADLPLMKSMLGKAYGDDFIDLPNSKYAEGLENYTLMSSERVTTNQDARMTLLNMFEDEYGKRYTENPEVELNLLIDQATDDDIIKAVETSNGYGRRYIKYLRDQNLLTPDKIKAFRVAMKYVPAVTGTAVATELVNDN